LTTLAIAFAIVLIVNIMLFIQCGTDPHSDQTRQEFLQDLPLMFPLNLLTYWVIISIIVFTYHKTLPFIVSLPGRRRGTGMPQQPSPRDSSKAANGLTGTRDS